MADRKKILKGLEYCKRTDGVECPYCPYWPDGDCVETLHSDIFELLKAHEAETIECKMCGHRLQKDWNWCPWCRWEIRQGYNADELS